MAIADRKERAFREREALIIEHADEMLRERGYLGLNLDEVARRIEYSKATIYNHFKTKEDLVLAVAVSHVESRTEYFQRALTFDGNPRERMVVIGVADNILAKLHPHWFPVLQLVQTQSIWEKAAEVQHQRFFDSFRRCMGVTKEIIRQGRAAGDIPPEALSDEHILFGTLSMAKGAHLLAGGVGILPGNSMGEPSEMLLELYHALLDGLGWRPFTRDWDYEKTMQRIQSELFSEELSQLAA